jgi:DNA repair protein RadC
MIPLTSTQPREHLIVYGESALSLEQVISLILGSGVSGHPVHLLSAQVAQVIKRGEPTRELLLSIPGLGPAKAGAIIGALALSRLLEGRVLSDKLQTPEDVYRACSDIIKEPKEHLVVFFLDVRSGIVSRELVSLGTATASVVHAREVFRAAITHNAHSVLLAHNHPSGDPAPSSADLQVTEALARAGKCIGIELLDHVVCARTGWHSLKQSNPELFR